MKNLGDIYSKDGKPIQDDWAKKLQKQWRRCIERFEEDQSAGWRKKHPRIEVLILENSNVNAFACKIETGYAIAIYDGLRVALRDLFLTILADPRSFPVIGDFRKESLSTVGEPAAVPDVSAFLKKGQVREPIDPTRRQFAMYMAELSLRFVFLHELSHILLGHVDLDSTAEGTIHECALSNEDSEISNHATEMHADETAFMRMLFWALDSFRNVEKIDPMQSFITPTLHGVLLDIFCASYCLFQLFEEFGSQKHPDTIHRQIRLALVLDYLVKVLKLPLDEKPENIAFTVISNVDRYMHEILGIDWLDRQNEMQSTLNFELKSKIMAYSNAVQALYPHLTDVAFVKFD